MGAPRGRVPRGDDQYVGRLTRGSSPTNAIAIATLASSPAAADDVETWTVTSSFS
ncbi:kinesin-like protein KIN-13A isoform X1 [Iris pallida]|uniref:Kinesin-like protein KIN-13A isoform X1 n=1 Tax=Iris pallida TaxID=29817 RepID=A0AAX6EGC8_IRIPA|nr:kinesin-like protein KIN-13A isoform X1 [Iris pallida]